VKKKILTLEIITILIIMILTLTGCGNKEENSPAGLEGTCEKFCHITRISTENQ